MNVLVDTSIWSLALRHRQGRLSSHAFTLEQLIAERRVVMIGPVRQELLSGVRESAQFDRLELHLAAFPDLLPDTQDYVEAARFCNRCRAKGVQGSSTDFLICAIAARHKLAIYTTDNDFSRFAKQLPVTLFPI